MRYLDKKILRKVYSRREPWVHKGRFGRLALISGSERHTGSACFAGMAAYKAGTDLVYVIAPQRAADVAANFSPVLMTIPLQGTRLEQKHVGQILDTLGEVKATAAVIGPGLWRAGETLEAIIQLLGRINLPTVIDADAIRAVGQHRDSPRPEKCILTPHINEFGQLGGTTVDEQLSTRAKSVQSEARRLGSTILLKGHIDIISDGKKTLFNGTGTSYMTKGGLGDTLAGICGAYLARGVDCLTAACAGAYVNGKAGEISSRKYGESLLPTDLIESIHQAIRL
jgi:NAD(P)H-hydrate epimerase